MNLNEILLQILSDSEPMGVNAVIRDLEGNEGFELGELPSPRDIVDALETMVKTGEVVHSFGHGGSVYRKRTGYQLEQWRAVQTGKQPELL